MRAETVGLLASLLLTASSIAAQPQPPRTQEPVPVEVALDAVTAAYSTRAVADEVSVKFRTRVAGGGTAERSDTLVIKLLPGDTPRSGPKRMFLDLGPLKVLGADRMLTAISTAAPGRFAQRAYEPPLTPAVLGTFMPPVPLPQLAFACGDPAQQKNPTPYTLGVTWDRAVADTSARPAIVTITGTCPSGDVTLVSDIHTGRILRLAAAIRDRTGESTLELTCKAIDPGDPAAWHVKTEGRELVPGVADLRPAPAKHGTPATPGAQPEAKDPASPPRP